ncbi:waprin-Phi1-like [Chrysoperla carnea]|uniref:waprin-Phi1-like n=1 Tax=Chrysoperla carnea TaxID=189513 RepID=UPI001D07B9EF|nr:waprin-Phi1-like [Chrysoperla carnea]
MLHLKPVIILICVFSIILSTIAQEDVVVKNGDCPPPTQVGICRRTCFNDSHCAGIGKCCPTSCGGSICTRPVTRRAKKEKAGVCPENPTGRWVCTSTCEADSDCKGRLKCCTNRCGALACQKPEEEVTEY